MLIGGSISVDAPLVIKRNLAESGGRGYYIDDRNRWNVFIRSKVISRIYRLQDISNINYSDTALSAKYQSIILREISSSSRFLLVSGDYCNGAPRVFCFENNFLLPVFRFYGERMIHAFRAAGLRKTKPGKWFEEVVKNLDRRPKRADLR
jgi:hypothetical protein